MNHFPVTTHIIGKYALTATAALMQSGAYVASLSIRSGQGSRTHDRVFRFVPQFLTSGAAIDYAHAQGHLYVRDAGRALAAPAVPDIHY